jgi:hypothetical protein
MISMRLPSIGFKSFVKKRKKSFKFFVHPPKWFLLEGKADTLSWAQEQKAEWTKLIRRIEYAHKVHDTKTFFDLVKRASQVKKSGMPLRGLIKDKEDVTDKDVNVK